MTTRGEINSNFYQIVNVDANGAPTSVKPQYLPNVGNANYAANAGHANIADVANLVAVANVSGIGNIATINLSGNGSQLLAGNGTWIATPNTASANYANYAGNVVGNSQPNITSVGTLTSLTLTGNINTPTAVYSDGAIAPTPGSYVGLFDSTFSNGYYVDDATVQVTKNANTWTFGGDGNLTLPSNTASINYANGSPYGGSSNVANANYANFAGTAFSVNGGNVTGTVGNATHATIADSANSVSAANIVGTVNLANYATVANSVAVANVIGIGNIATINLSGNGSQLLAGNGSWIATPNTANANYANFAGTAFSVSGSNVSGDVAGANHANIADVANLVAGANVTGTVGNATHATTADSANSVAGANVTGQVANALVSGTVYSNSQPNITSVGTLTDLTVTGNIQSFADISGAYIYGNGAYLTGVGNLSAQRGYWGSFYSNVSQTIASTTTAYPITLNNSDPDSYGISVSSNSHINFTYAGTYNLQFSAQFVNTNTAIQEASVWLRKNGVDVADTRGSCAITDKQGGVNGQIIESWNYILKLNAGDYLELIWQAEDTSVSLEYLPGGTTPTSPASPSIIVTAMQVTNVQPVELQGDMTGNIVGNGFSLINIASISSLDGITGNTFTGNGAPLTNLTGANVTGNVGNAVHAYFADVANSVSGSNVSGQVANALVAGTVYTNSQPNITSVGTLSSLTATGNITGNYFIGNGSALTGITATTASNANTILVNAVITGTTYYPTFTVSLGNGYNSLAKDTSGPFSYNVSNGTVKSQEFDGVLVDTSGTNNTKVTLTSTTATIRAGAVNTLTISNTSANINGNVQASRFISNVATGTAPFTVTSTTQVANLSVATAGTATTAGSATTAGTVTTNAQPNITSVGTLTSLSSSGNITAPRFISNIATGNAPFIVTSTTQVANLNVATAGSATTAGTVTTNAQPNITSVGTLTSLNVSGNIFSNTAVYIGNTSNATGLTNPTLVAKASGATYVQGALINGSTNGSADWVAYGDNGSDSGAWADMGFTSSNFSDPLYTITGINDGYLFVQGDDSSAHGGNLVFATGPQGSTKDIVFATGGFLSTNEKMRFINATNQFYIQPTTAATDTTTGALRVAGGVGIGGDVYAGNIVSANYFVGDGSLLTGITSTNANYANFAGNAFSVDAGNIVGTVNLANYATVANSVAVANVSGIGNIATVNLDGNASNILFGNGVFAAAPSVSNVANANYANFAGTSFSVAGGNVTGTVGNAVHADYADTANSVAGINVTGTVANATYAITAGSATTAATVTTNAQPNITSLGTLTSLSVTGNLTTGNASLGNLATSNFFSGNGHYLSDLTGANVTGTVANSTYALSANTSNTSITVTGGSQPNITSLGTLTSLDVSGNVSANYYIGNGSALTGVTATATPAGANTQIQFNDGGVTGANANFTYDKVFRQLNLNNANSSIFIGNGLYPALVAINGGSSLAPAGSGNIEIGGTLNAVGANISGTTRLNSIANVKITGGSSGQVISTDGTGNLSFVAQSGGGGSSGFENIFLMMGA